MTCAIDLDKGALVSTPPTFGIHGKIQSQVVRLIPKAVGLTLVDTGFLLSPDTLRAPDVAFFSAHRARGLDLTTRITAPPDRAVEIISPSETAARPNARPHYSFGAANYAVRRRLKNGFGRSVRTRERDQFPQTDKVAIMRRLSP